MVFCLKARRTELPLCRPARPGVQPDEDRGTLNCPGTSLGSRTRLCLPGKLRGSEAAGGDVAAVPQRGRLVQGSQPGPALMLGPAAHGPRAGPGGEPHSLTLRRTDGRRLLLGASRHHPLCAAARFSSCSAAGRPPYPNRSWSAACLSFYTGKTPPETQTQHHH